MSPLKIEKSLSIVEIEGLWKKFSDLEPGQAVEVFLPRNPKPRFFKDLRLALFIGDLNRRHRIVFRDYGVDLGSFEAQRFYRSTAPGIASVSTGRPIIDRAGAELRLPFAELRAGIVTRGGRMEDLTPPVEPLAEAIPEELPETLGRKITLCAFDPENPEPLDFAGLASDDVRFKATFRRLRQKFVDIEKESLAQDLFQTPAEENLGRFAFELYQNGLDHGRYDVSENLKEGIRFFQIKRYFSPNRDIGVQLGDGCVPLHKYLSQRWEKTKKSELFYEVSVSDMGQGILDRFLSRRRDFKSENPSIGRKDLLKRLLETNLTSKIHSPGAGSGWPNALRAVQELGGFISVRTGEFWFYYSAEEQGSTDVPQFRELLPSQQLGWMTGTNVGVVIPLASGGSRR